MARLVEEQAAVRALETYRLYADRCQRIYGLHGTSFEGGYLDYDGGDILAAAMIPGEEALSYVFPYWQVYGSFTRLPIGTFALFLSRHEPGWAPLSLTATVALGNHRAFSEGRLMRSLVDPERRVGLGAWYEITADFAEEREPVWQHGFYAHKNDPYLSRLDRIWRRLNDRLRDKPVRLHPDLLFTGLWERILSRSRF